MTDQGSTNGQAQQQALQREIAKAVSAGWKVTTQSDSTATLTRKPKFSWIWFLVWAILFFILGGFIYWIYWQAKKDLSMYIQVDSTGKVTITES